MQTLYGDTFLHIEGAIIPLRSAVRYSESWASVAEPEDYQTWDGETHIVAPTYKTKYRVVLSVSDALNLPGLDEIQPGAEVIFHSRIQRTAVIPAGSSQCILSRDPVPGSITVRDPATHAIIPHTQDGRTISIAAPAASALAVIHSWRMICLLKRPIETSVDGQNGNTNWSIEVVETSAPA